MKYFAASLHPRLNALRDVRLAVPVALCSCVLLLAASAWGAASADLERLLDQMDKAGQNFRSTEAGFSWKQFTAVVNETEVQKGKVYFRRAGSDIEMAVDVSDPYPKYVLLTDSKLQLFEPRINRVTSYDLEKNRAEVESFLVLGFGGGGHAMLKSFEIQYLGTEKINGVDTAKLDLVPKSEKIRTNTFPHIILWVDPARGVAVQQQLFQTGGDYRLAEYSDIRVNQKIPDAVFKLKTSGKTVYQSTSGGK